MRDTNPHVKSRRVTQQTCAPIAPDEESKQVTDIIKKCYDRGWCPATSSNFSFKTDSSSDFWISQSGIDKEHFQQSNFMAVDHNGSPVSGELRKPSAETLLHAMTYNLRPSTRAVLHVHSPLSVVVSRIHQADGFVNFEGWELQKGIKGISTHESTLRLPIFPNAQHMPSLVTEISPIISAEMSIYGFLLAGHGLYAFGDSITEAKRHLEVYNALLESKHLMRIYQ